MRFYEYESKALFERLGLPLGPRRVVSSADEARSAAAEIGCPVVLKGQVLSGGRMKAGAVQFADTPDEAAKHYEAILPIVLGGESARSVLRADNRASWVESASANASPSPRSVNRSASSSPRTSPWTPTEYSSGSKV